MISRSSIERVRARLRNLLHLNPPWGETIYSQSGIERFLWSIFSHKKGPGFYVDVGAFHPLKLSNTQQLYERGWSGINIDATPGSMAPFNEWRPRDTNLEIGVGMEKGTCEYYMFNEPTLNSFSKELSLAREKRGKGKILNKVRVEVMPLASILEQNISQGQQIDLLSVDAEGRDLEVLESNDWSRFKPEIVLAEALQLAPKVGDSENDLVRLMNRLGYEIVFWSIHDIAFRRLD